jgi:hypothetical protein
MKNDLEKFIQNNREKFDNKTPDPAVLGRILDQMQAIKETKPKGILVPFWMVRLVAASLILFACGITYKVLQKQPDAIAVVKTKVPAVPGTKNPADDAVKPASSIEIVKTERAKPENIEAVDEDLARRKRAILAKLTDRTSHSEKHMMFARLNNMNSSAARIAAVVETPGFKNTGNNIVDALVATLNNDPNANVRLAALDGLARFYQETYVKKKLIASLKRQQDPVVQITMINLLIRMRESGIVSELESIINDENAQKAVKDCAYSGILQLRSS